MCTSETEPPESGGSSKADCPTGTGFPCCYDHGVTCCWCGKPKFHEHEWGPWELRPTIGDNVEASYCACGASKARQCEPDADRAMCACGFDPCVEEDHRLGCKVFDPPPGSAPRPPYAVAYAVQGGALYEVALPGDATAATEGGRLVITHSGMPVTGIVRIAPMRTEES